MRVAVDGLYAVPHGAGGTWTYLRSLMRDLPACAPDAAFAVFVNREAAGQIDTVPGRVREVRIPLSGEARLARLAYEYAALPVQAWRQDTDVLFAPSFTLPAAPPGAVSVVTIHDMRHEDLPQSFVGAEGAILRRFARHSVRHAAHVITDSHHARRRLIAVYGLDPDRVHAVSLAAEPHYFARATEADHARVAARYDLRRPYILSIALPSWQKNLAVLVEAYIAWRKATGAGVQLVLPGWRRLEDAPELWAKVRAAGLEHEVRRVGWVPDEDLPTLYQGAMLHVVPSRYEGFGLPVLEAMASGVPVITSSATSLPEVAGDAALLFVPDDHAALVAALRHLHDDPDLRARLVQGGMERAREFSWRATAERTYAVLARAHAENRR